MKGFFNKEETTSTIRPDGKSYSCISCGRFKSAESPRLEIGGNFEKGILIIANATSKKQDVNPKSSTLEMDLLRNSLERNGIDLERDCYYVSSNRCYSEEPQTSFNIDCCRKNILKIVEEKTPKMILCLGHNALYSLIGLRWKKDFKEMAAWDGWLIPDQDLKTWLCPIYSPDYVLSADEKNTVRKKLWHRSVSKALTCLEKPFPIIPKPIVGITDDLRCLEGIKSGVISIDYETTGIKPYAEGHRIVCASVAISDKLCYSFLMPKTRKQREPFLRLLRDPKIGKMAHNMKYEDTWTNIRLKTEVVNWVWDSMIAAHVLDNRYGIVGLKFQTYVNFGYPDYDSEISPYLTSDRKEKGSNGFNRIMDCLEDGHLTKTLLTYCGYDTVFQFKLAMKQIAEIEPTFYEDIKRNQR